MLMISILWDFYGLGGDYNFLTTTPIAKPNPVINLIITFFLILFSVWYALISGESSMLLPPTITIILIK